VSQTIEHAAPARANLHVGNLHYASEKAVVERVLGNRPGIIAVDANPVAQTATVTFDPVVTSVEELAQWVEECGYHCAGRSVPGHVCDPLAEEGLDAPVHDHAGEERAEHTYGHGHGGHAGMSMAEMVADMRNRFLVAHATSRALCAGCCSGLAAKPCKWPTSRRWSAAAGKWFA
jgi:P-type Cu2+ transporter